MAKYIGAVDLGTTSNRFIIFDGRGNWAEDKTWQPHMGEAKRHRGIAEWHKAVQRTLDWVD